MWRHNLSPEQNGHTRDSSHVCPFFCICSIWHRYVLSDQMLCSERLVTLSRRVDPYAGIPIKPVQTLCALNTNLYGFTDLNWIVAGQLNRTAYHHGAIAVY